MKLEGMEVKHKVFGTGIIMEASSGHLTIKFETKVSKFIYPDAFEKFIVASDASVQAEIMKEHNTKKQAAEIKRQEAEAVLKVEEMRKVAERQNPFIKRNKTNIEAGFGSDYNVRYLARQPILTYQQVEDQYGIKISGFGRGINRTSSTIVLISSVNKRKSGFLYHDHWTIDGDYLYSGEGKTGDQKLTLGNKAIVDAEHDGKAIHLFVKLSPQEYYYQGVFTLADYNYEDDKDENGNVRKEYKFRLRKNCL